MGSMNKVSGYISFDELDFSRLERLMDFIHMSDLSSRMGNNSILSENSMIDEDGFLIRSRSVDTSRLKDELILVVDFLVNDLNVSNLRMSISVFKNNIADIDSATVKEEEHFKVIDGKVFSAPVIITRVTGEYKS